jgi:hypothetical protein
MYSFVGNYVNAVEAGEKLGVSVSNIRVVASGKKDVHKGYYFSYKPLDPSKVTTGNYDKTVDPYQSKLVIATRKRSKPENAQPIQRP